MTKGGDKFYICMKDMFGFSKEIIVIFGIFFVFLMTTLGAGIVFFIKKQLSDNFNRIFLGFASGVMIAASVWSLLLPALEDSKTTYGDLYWLPATLGFLIGGMFLLLVDHILPHLHINDDKPEGVRTKLNRTTMLVFAIGLHNAPEGLAVGFAFGYALKTGSSDMLATALGLAIGIGIQNFPEGAAVSIPLKDTGVSTKKAFFLGSLSGFVEPVFAGLGLLMASSLSSVMPWFLAFAAGAMIYVVVEELIPEAQLDSHSHVGTFAVLIGFIVMMILDGVL
jgi:ZIP family zinc transporter